MALMSNYTERRQNGTRYETRLVTRDELILYHRNSWWRHQMETFSALLAICAGNSPVPGEFPTQRPVTRSFDVCFDLCPNKRLSKQEWDWWFETQSRPLWRHRNVYAKTLMLYYVTDFHWRIHAMSPKFLWKTILSESAIPMDKREKIIDSLSPYHPCLPKGQW